MYVMVIDLWLSLVISGCIKSLATYHSDYFITLSILPLWPSYHSAWAN